MNNLKTVVFGLIKLAPDLAIMDYGIDYVVVMSRESGEATRFEITTNGDIKAYDYEVE